MKIKSNLILLFLIALVAQEDVFSQASNTKVSGFKINLYHKLEIVSVPSIFDTFLGASEDVDLDVVGIDFGVELKKIDFIGVSVNYGQRFRHWNDNSNGRIKRGDVDVDDYLSIGITLEELILPRFLANEKAISFDLISKTTVSYISFNGYEQEGTRDRNEFKDLKIRGLDVSGGISASIKASIKDRFFIEFYYQPISIEIGTYGVGIGYLHFGFSIAVLN